MRSRYSVPCGCGPLTLERFEKLKMAAKIRKIFGYAAQNVCCRHDRNPNLVSKIGFWGVRNPSRSLPTMLNKQEVQKNQNGRQNGRQKGFISAIGPKS